MTERSGSYTVVSERNDHGAATLREHPRNATLQVVGVDCPDAERALSEAKQGSVLELELRRDGRRGNAWRVTAARDRDSGE